MVLKFLSVLTMLEFVVVCIVISCLIYYILHFVVKENDVIVNSSAFETKILLLV